MTSDQTIRWIRSIWLYNNGNIDSAEMDRRISRILGELKNVYNKNKHE